GGVHQGGDACAEAAQPRGNGGALQGAGAHALRRHRMAGVRAHRSRWAAVIRKGNRMESPIALNSLVLGSLPARHARYRPHHTAVIVAGRAPRERDIRLDWREFDDYVNRYASMLTGLGVVRGDRVATVLGNSLELLGSIWACAKLGAAAVPL